MVAMSRSCPLLPPLPQRASWSQEPAQEKPLLPSEKKVEIDTPEAMKPVKSIESTKPAKPKSKSKSPTKFTSPSSVTRLWKNILRPEKHRPISPHPPATLLAQRTHSWLYLTSPDAPQRVIKIAPDRIRLRQEFDTHKKIEQAFMSLYRSFNSLKINIELPYITEPKEFFLHILTSEKGGMFRNFSGLPKHAAGYSMEYIRPFNTLHAKYLIKRHLDPSAHEAALDNLPSQHFLAKVHMGGIRPAADGWQVNLHDRPIYMDQLVVEGGDLRSYACSMGSTLAALHWRCSVDAVGVKFVLGVDSCASIQLWLIDFGHCSTFEATQEGLVKRLVDAIVYNEPFWPRWINLEGQNEVWGHFRLTYLQASKWMLGRAGLENGLTELAGKFMTELDKVRGSGRDTA